MAKVVLVWNEHPTEVVAGYHARKVAQILKEKYGHEVIMEKVRVAETNYGLYRTIRPFSIFEKILQHTGHFLYKIEATFA